MISHPARSVSGGVFVRSINGVLWYTASQMIDDQQFTRELGRAIRFGQQRKYDKAVAVLEGLATGGNGSHPEVYLYLARSWHALGNFTRAAAYARRYTGEKEEDPAGWFFLGRACLADGLYDRAIHALRISLEYNPASIDCQALLGLSCLKARRPALALRVFEAALEQAPDDERLNQGYLNALFVEAVRALRRGDPEAARARLTFLINNDIDGVAPRLYLAHSLRELGYLPEALSQYEAALQFAPDDETLHWYPVTTLLAMGETEQAAELMSRLGSPPEDLNIDDATVDLIIIRNHLEAAEWDKAAHAARLYIKTRGSDPRVHALMGEAQRNLGQYEKALNHFNRSLSLQKDENGPHYGILMTLLAARDWTELHKACERARRAGCDEQTVELYAVIADGHLDTDPAELLPRIQDAVRTRGAVPELIAILARAYFRLDLSDLAIGWYRKAVELDDSDEDVWLGYIASCEAQEQEDELHTAYQGYLERWDDNCSIRREWIRYLDTAGRYSDAADQSEQLARFEPSESLERMQALYRRKAGQWREAAVLYRALLRRTPENEALLNNLIYSLDKMGETERARALLHEANRVFPKRIECRLIEAVLLERLDRTEDALAVYREVADKWPRDPRAWEHLAAIYRAQGVPSLADTFAQTARDLRHAKKKPAGRKT